MPYNTYGRIGPVEKTTLYLADGQQRALRALSRRRRKPQAELIREAIDAYLKRQDRPRPRSVGLGEDEKVSGATSEDYLRARWQAR